MANFKVPNGGDISWFDFPLGREVTLLQWGGDPQGKPLQPAVDGSVSGVVAKQIGPAPGASTLFSIKGSIQNDTFQVLAFLAGTSTNYSEPLSCKVCGLAHKQPGYTVDLLSNIPLTEEAKYIHRYSRIFRDNQDSTNILSQDTRKGHYNCGDVANSYGALLFGKSTFVDVHQYYDKPTTDKMADLTFNADLVNKGVAKIVSLLNKGTPVRVWLIHDDGFRSHILPDWRTHYLTIIGYNYSRTRFLYLDPWPEGSVLNYDGGFYPPQDIHFMGELAFDPLNPSQGLSSPAGHRGYHDYRVIAGP